MRIFGEKIVDPNDNTRFGEFDNKFKAPIGIDVGHHEIHEGDSFVIDTVDESMADGDVLSLAFKTPVAGKRIHMLVEGIFKGAGHMEITEDSTWAAGSGTQLSLYNRERNSTGSSILLENTTGGFVANDAMVLNSSSYAVGTIIHSFYVFADRKTGGEARAVDELVLKPNTEYMILMEADVGTNAAHMTLNWYEHESQ